MLQFESSWHGRSVDHVSTYSGRQIAVGTQEPSRITRQNTCCAGVSNMSVPVVFANRSGFDAPMGIILAWEERGSRLNIFWMKNHCRISETFTNYEAKDLLRKSVDHVSTYPGRQIAVGSQKPSRITRQKTCCASESNTLVRVVFANRSGFDAPIGVVFAWEERGSCLNIFRRKNHDRISETFTNYEAKDLLRKSVDHVSTYSGRQTAVGSQKPSRITRQKTCCACELNTSVRVVFANRSGFDAPMGVVLAWEESGSCLNIFQTKNHGRISENLTNYEVKDLLCKSVDHVSTYSERQIAVGSQKPSRIKRQKTCCARTWIMSQHIPDDKSRSDLRNLHELRGKRLVAQVSETRRLALYLRTGVVLMIQLESSWRGRSVDHVSTYSRPQIAVGSRKPSRVTRQKTRCASESSTSVRVVLANRSGFDAPIRVFLAWVEHGSCLNIFRMTNHGRISKTFTNYEAKDLSRK
ncbi:uncharacterized protein G2W53_033623 [Senna tora]|uniref:Uncharacterized protein n=1 Tax=Senna tora TaxID=362788 RepID=A0A834W854_9FABA|nr:uncharacterized protein G2W53_033623 [Senna tora]